MIAERAWDDFYEYFKGCLVCPDSTSLPADHGRSDQVLHDLARDLRNVRDAIELIDYGCGSGRLIEVLNSLDPQVLQQMTYIGIDSQEDALIKTARHAIDVGFIDRVRRRK